MSSSTKNHRWLQAQIKNLKKLKVKQIVIINLTKILIYNRFKIIRYLILDKISIFLMMNVREKSTNKSLIVTVNFIYNPYYIWPLLNIEI